ncbi:hypothetical protein CDL15_Pgr000301 [Punica granatum]|uniref:Uncharacterized protein n=1 Tax=Punica granatum TaxID=22663 RepID=A0A218Y227_PUNGR|nr:hypothetical protein CDL15_Pgr000301 [Punica granatum]
MTEGDTLISAGGKFQLGFFSTGNSSNRYLGIWFYNIPSRTIVWSFNHPADTMLAGMKIGWDFKLGIERQLTSWKSAEDPSLGQFSYRMDPRGPQPKMLEGNITRYRGFPHFSAFSSIRTYFESIISLIIVYNTQETYGTYYLRDQGTLSRLLVNYTGKVQQYMWNNQTLDWMLLYELPSDACDEYSKCGPNAVCVVANTVRTCKCLPGYVSKLARDSNTPNLLYSGGYVRKSPFNCSVSEGFKLVRPVKLPELSQFEMNSCMSINECEKMCLMNCTCTAYSRTGDSSDRTGCQFWFGDLLDIRELIKGFMRKKLVVAMAMVLSVSSAMVCSWVSWRRRKGQGVRSDIHDEEEENFELPTFDAVMISQATNDFSYSNKIGEGGFGPVYKGQLPNGQEIAVKRLSETSRQGLNEFKNEVMLIAKLQHRNLVRDVALKEKRGCFTSNFLPVWELVPFKSGQFLNIETNEIASLVTLLQLYDLNEKFFIAMIIIVNFPYVKKISKPKTASSTVSAVTDACISSAGTIP